MNNIQITRQLIDKQNELSRLRYMLNALPANVVLLDENAKVMEANEGWKEFAGGKPLTNIKVDQAVNYFDTLQQCAGLAEKSEFSESLKKILAGKIHFFSTVYPCHSPNEKRWFRVVATRKSDKNKTIQVPY